MKRLQKIALLLTLIALFASCQSNTDVNQILSKTDTRKQIMDSIANNSMMAKEMMTAMMAILSGFELPKLFKSTALITFNKICYNLSN